MGRNRGGFKRVCAKKNAPFRGRFGIRMPGGSAVGLLQPLLEPVDRVVALQNVGLLQQRGEQRHRGVDAIDDQLAQRPAEARQRLLPVAPVHDQLADQAVVIGRDLVAVIERRIDAHTEPARGVVLGDAAGAGGEVRQPLGVDPHFDRGAADLQVFLAEFHRLTGRDADLFAHQIDAEDRLGHRVFHLQPGVHLDEVEFAVLEQELDRAGARIAELGHRVGADLADPRALFGGDAGAGSLFQHLLVAALQRAVALAQMHGAALAIAEDLDLDVTRLLEIFLHVDLVIAEGGLRLRTRGAEGDLEVGLGLGDFHAAPTAAGGGLDDHRIADLGRGALRLVDVMHATGRARHHRDTEALRGFLGGDLVAHDADMLRRGADEGNAVILEHLHEVRVFRKEAIARMDRLGAGDLAGGDDRGDREIALGRRRRADADALVGHAHMHGVAVGGRVHRDRGDPHLAAGADHPQGDLAPVGDQDLVEHGHALTRRSSAPSRIRPACRRRRGCA
ncbi:hypothetical protein SDC9_30578 [bioreactor metagenome]|uniref:NAD-specific glutamate dehydrogenase n=1 Tax=bioreactor metagenome TaxID=1076179 RepID=A0A644V135_9ZZZZ